MERWSASESAECGVVCVSASARLPSFVNQVVEVTYRGRRGGRRGRGRECREKGAVMVVMIVVVVVAVKRRSNSDVVVIVVWW